MQFKFHFSPCCSSWTGWKIFTTQSYLAGISSTLHYSTTRLHYKDQSANMIYGNYNSKNYRNPLHILWENYRVLSTKKVVRVITNILSKASRFPLVIFIAPLFHIHAHPHVAHSRMTYGWTLGTAPKPKLFRKLAIIRQKIFRLGRTRGFGTSRINLRNKTYF